MREVDVPDQSFFREVFDELSVAGAIGNPQGELAYCYVRVSSAGQADEGRSGLPRQIVHIHDVATESGYKIPWELVFADDHTGFEFKQRPALSRLRDEVKRTNRRAHAIVIESLDRLSRNADWHQGYLLEEMTECGLKVVFWKSFSSRIERAVIGAISQEGMEESKRRMAEGNILKAKNGRITARTPAYGYRFVDSSGIKSDKTRKDTHYAPRDDEAEVIRLIFSKIAIEGWSTRQLSTWLEERYAPPKQSVHWEPAQVALLVRSTVYKGEYIAHRHKHVKVPKVGQLPGEPTKLVSRKIERPRDEWISVSIPPIVSPELWQMANRALDKNVQMGRRNAKEPYLLTGLIQCATCGHSYIGGRKRYIHKDGSVTQGRFYRCSSRSARAKHISMEIGCVQGQIQCQVVDDAVWTSLCSTLLQPQILIDHLERAMLSGDVAQVKQQSRALQRQLQECDREDQKLYQAYMADVFDEHEFAVRRRRLKEARALLVQELEELRTVELTEDEFQERKRLVLAMAKYAEENGLTADAPFEIKQRIIKLLVDKVVLNVGEGWLRIEGITPGRVNLEGSIEKNPVDKPG